MSRTTVKITITPTTMAATIAPEPSREAERGKKALFTKLSLYGLKFAKFKVHL